jgi:hypothetical protein
MPANKPASGNTDIIKWAFDASALKRDPSNKEQLFGWTTSTGTVSGTPEKPILQYENGWRYHVYTWVEYLVAKTDEQTPAQAGKNNLFLSTDGATPSWQSVYPTIGAADVTGKKVLLATTASTDPTKLQVSWGYPWATPGATTDGNPLVFAYNTGGYSWQTAFPVLTGNASKRLAVNAGATAVEWVTTYEIPTPSSGAGYILQSTGTTAGAYAWTAPSFAASVITSGTVAVGRLPIYQGATSGAVGVAGVVPPAPAGSQGSYLTGGGAWQAIREVTTGGTNGQFLQTNGITYSWANVTIDASAVISGTLAALRLPSYVGATSSVAGTKGAVPAANAGDEAKYLTGAGTWIAPREVPLPASTGLVFTSTGVGTYAWQTPSFAASAITSGTFTASQIPTYVGATSSVAGTKGAVPAANAGDEAKYLTGAGTWLAISQVPSQSLQAGKYLTTDGTTASWATIYQVPTPGLTGLTFKSTGALAGQFAWQNAYEVPTPSSAGLILQSSGAAAGNYAWATPSFTADKISGGTVGQLLTSDGTKGTWSSLTAAQVPALDAAKITTGTFTVAQIPSLDAAKITTGTFLSSQIPSLDTAKITTGVFANARIGAFTGATSGAAGSTGGVPVAAAGDQGKFLRGDATWQAVPVFGMLTSAASGTQTVDFSLYNTVSALAIAGSITFSFSTLSAGRIVTIICKSTAGSQTITWPTGIKWADGLPLTAATTVPASVTIVSLGTTTAECYATVVRSFS